MNPSYLLPGKAQPKALQSLQQQQQLAAKQDIIPGFVAAEADVSIVHYPPPLVPASFVPLHKFVEDAPGACAVPPPPLTL